MYAPHFEVNLENKVNPIVLNIWLVDFKLYFKLANLIASSSRVNINLSLTQSVAPGALLVFGEHNAAKGWNDWSTNVPKNKLN